MKETKRDKALIAFAVIVALVVAYSARSNSVWVAFGLVLAGGAVRAYERDGRRVPRVVLRGCASITAPMLILVWLDPDLGPLAVLAGVQASAAAALHLELHTGNVTAQRPQSRPVSLPVPTLAGGAVACVVWSPQIDTMDSALFALVPMGLGFSVALVLLVLALFANPEHPPLVCHSAATVSIVSLVGIILGTFGASLTPLVSLCATAAALVLVLATVVRANAAGRRDLALAAIASPALAYAAVALLLERI